MDCYDWKVIFTTIKTYLNFLSLTSCTIFVLSQVKGSQSLHGTLVYLQDDARPNSWPTLLSISSLAPSFPLSLSLLKEWKLPHLLSSITYKTKQIWIRFILFQCHIFRTQWTSSRYIVYKKHKSKYHLTTNKCTYSIRNGNKTSYSTPHELSILLCSQLGWEVCLLRIHNIHGYCLATSTSIKFLLFLV